MIDRRASRGPRFSDRRGGWAEGLGWIVALALTGAVGFGYAWLGYGEVFGGFGGDNAVYYMMGRHYSPWIDGGPVAEFFATTTPYPPLYPFVLGFTGAASSIQAAHLATAAMTLLACVALYSWLRAMGLPAALSVGAALVFAVMPGTYLSIFVLNSEALYLLLSIAVLALAAHDADRRGNSMILVNPALWIAAVLVAGVVLTRTAGLALAAAFVLHVLVHDRTRALWLIALAVGPIVVWSAIDTREHQGYVSLMLREYAGLGPGAMLQRLLFQLTSLWAGWQGNLEGPGSRWPLASILLAALALIGAARRAIDGRSDGLYVFVYLGLIVVWPFPAEARRMLLVLVPVAVGLAVWTLATPARGYAARTVHSVAAAAVLVILAIPVVPTLLIHVQRAATPFPVELERYGRWEGRLTSPPPEAVAIATGLEALHRAAAEVTVHVPESDCVLSTKPPIVSAASNRISIGPPFTTVPDDEFGKALAELGCRFAIGFAFRTPSYPVQWYPLGRITGAREVARWSPRGAPNGAIVGALVDLSPSP